MVAQSLTHAYPQDCAGWGGCCLGSRTASTFLVTVFENGKKQVTVQKYVKPVLRSGKKRERERVFFESLFLHVPCMICLIAKYSVLFA